MQNIKIYNEFVQELSHIMNNYENTLQFKGQNKT